MTKKTTSGIVCEYSPTWNESCGKPATYTLRYVSGDVHHYCKIHYQYFKRLVAEPEK